MTRLAYHSHVKNTRQMVSELLNMRNGQSPVSVCQSSFGKLRSSEKCWYYIPNIRNTLWIGAKVKVEINKKMENESEWESGMSEITWACSNRGNKENKLGQSKAKHFHRRACQLLRVLLEANLPKQTNLYSGFISEYQKYICQYKQTRNYGSIFEYQE